MDACYWIKVPQWSVKTGCKERKKTSSSNQWCQNSDLTYRKTEKSSQTSDRCLQEINLFLLLTTFHLVTFFPQYRAPVAGLPEAAPFVPCCSCTVYWTRGACQLTWWGDRRSPCWFRLNILKLIQKWQDSSSSFGRDFTGKFLSNLCLCAKAYVLYADGANRVCLCRAS